MSLESTMKEALAARPEVAALACMDGEAGLVLGMCIQGDANADEVELAALSAPELAKTPRDDGEPDDPAPEALVISDTWVHAFARVPARPELIIMGLARSNENIATLRVWLGEVAGQVGRAR